MDVVISSWCSTLFLVVTGKHLWLLTATGKHLSFAHNAHGDRKKPVMCLVFQRTCLASHGCVGCEHSLAGWLVSPKTFLKLFLIFKTAKNTNLHFFQFLRAQKGKNLSKRGCSCAQEMDHVIVRKHRSSIKNNSNAVNN